MLPDLLARGLDVVFCGINPGLYSDRVGHHFARPGNRFWPALFAAGFTPRLFTGADDGALPALGLGLTNIVARPSAAASELSRDELRAGARALVRKMTRLQPRYLAVVGFLAYRVAFDRRRAVGGLQPETIGATRIWLLPNPSGLNAHHPPRELARLFVELRRASARRPAAAVLRKV